MVSVLIKGEKKKFCIDKAKKNITVLCLYYMNWESSYSPTCSYELTKCEADSSMKLISIHLHDHQSNFCDACESGVSYMCLTYAFPIFICTIRYTVSLTFTTLLYSIPHTPCLRPNTPPDGLYYAPPNKRCCRTLPHATNQTLLLSYITTRLHYVRLTNWSFLFSYERLRNSSGESNRGRSHLTDGLALLLLSHQDPRRKILKYGNDILVLRCIRILFFIFFFRSRSLFPESFAGSFWCLDICESITLSNAYWERFLLCWSRTDSIVSCHYAVGRVLSGWTSDVGTAASGVTSQCLHREG